MSAGWLLGVAVLMLFAVTACFSSARSDATGATTTTAKATTPGGSGSSPPQPTSTASGSSTSKPDPSGAVALAPGDNLQSAVNESPAGTTFLLKNGHYSEVEITPKTGDTFTGQSRANVVLSGARHLEGWTRSGALWVVGGQNQHGTTGGECQTVSPRCDRPEELFLDSQLLKNVASVGAVTKGSWFFDYTNHQIYMGDDPAGHTVETSVTSFIFGGTAGKVTIQHLTVERAASPTSAGAIDGRYGTGWVIDDVTARENHGDGITLGSKSTARNFAALNNGMEGIGAGVCCGEHGANTVGVLFEDGEVAGNNTAGYDPGWGGGGSKFVATDGLVVQRLSVHDNNGPGLWTDISNVNTTYQDNVVTNNWGAGIFHEISYHAVIRNNTVRGNGFRMGTWLFDAGITISASSDVEVFGNTVQDCYNGITGVMQARGAGHTLTNLSVHDNTIQMTRGVTGISSGVPGSWYASAGNRFAGNKYVVSSSVDEPFSFGTSGAGSTMSFQAWQQLGQDSGGSLNASP
jgi:parallel beta-helix repeat protein